MSDDEDDYLYGPDEPDTKRQKENNPPAEPIAQDREQDQDDEEGSEEEDSDSDVEFVINTAPGEKVSAPTTTAAAYSGTKEESKPDSESGVVAESNKEGESTTERLDINAVAEHDGKPITQVNLEDFADKPWRQPGADITDYFNYGFDEFTWSAYCSKQDNLREDFSGQKVMNRMMGGMPGMAMPPMDMGMMFPMGNMNQNSGNKNNGQMDMNSMMSMMGMMPGFMPPGNNNMNQMPPQQQQQNDAYGGANIQAYGGNNQGGYKNQQQMRR